jgi:hypothetical protein
MHMIILTIKLHQLRLKVNTGFCEYPSQVIQDGFCEHVTPVFRHKDQMNMH